MKDDQLSIEAIRKSFEEAMKEPPCEPEIKFVSPRMYRFSKELGWVDENGQFTKKFSEAVYEELINAKKKRLKNK